MLNSSSLVGFVATANAKAAAQFYQSVLGLELVEDSPFALVFDSNGTTLRIQKVLEDANLKLTSVISDVLGMSGRAMIEAIIKGEQNPERLADLSQGRLKASRPAVIAAL